MATFPPRSELTRSWILGRFSVSILEEGGRLGLKCLLLSYFRVADDSLMTKEEGSVQLADAAWTLRGACKVSFSVNFLHPGRSGRQVT